MSDLYDIIRKIEKQPIVYLGRRSIIALYAFLHGYNVAKRELQLSKTDQELEFEFFQEWIKDKASIKSRQSWEKVILLFSTDDVKAFDKFFVLFEEFINRDKISENEKNEI
ncbi:hypothetical protein [Nostoc sp. 'Peltigera membranacea cyanobiont' 232]|uniref:hypothetical protein n=1 Tax=Nostoc sp. 'Peltigera membranacea cyanobiont' 232 TaxID=2014531 RepID=UPI000B9511E7|nr:hypothetical protein [Nostoc sp. 'Peltigera membranacea cyanobiont' 232]OYD99970.1 hypothetical protein CDG79_37815 [Nostoc sp. 'Peltigera membranacea cyanobiont' 232]